MVVKGGWCIKHWREVRMQEEEREKEIAVAAVLAGQRNNNNI